MARPKHQFSAVGKTYVVNQYVLTHFVLAIDDFRVTEQAG
jgi:hypothetical protein